MALKKADFHLYEREQEHELTSEEQAGEGLVNPNVGVCYRDDTHADDGASHGLRD